MSWLTVFNVSIQTAHRNFEEIGVSQSELTFRAQLVIPDQRDVYDYWLNCRDGDNLPARDDVNPVELKKHLSFVSLIDVEDDPQRFRVRLAGTGLRDVYGREMTGTYLEEDSHIDVKSLSRLVARGRPAQGVLPIQLPDRDNLIQFWLKLPLAEDGQKINMILGFDVFMQVPKARALANHHVAMAS